MKARNHPHRQRIATTITAITIIVLGVILNACGTTEKTVKRPRSIALAGAADMKSNTPYKGDEDDDDEESSTRSADNVTIDNDADADNDRIDNRGKGYLDHDDAVIADFGRPANAAEHSEVEALVKRFYAAALANDGAAGCAAIDSAFKASIPTDYGIPEGIPYAKGNTCPTVARKIFEHFHSEMLKYRFDTTRVRVKGTRGFVLLGSKDHPASYLPLHREHNQWKLVGIFVGPLP